jgi:3-dehydroquinate synthase
MEPITVTEKKNNQYEIVIKRDFDDLFRYVKTLAPDAKNILLLTDSTVNDLYADTVTSGLKEYNLVKYVIPAGEESKSKDNAFKILDTMYENGFMRFDLFISLGGGVVSDLGGFCASLYMRGIAHIVCPTTLLSMADASIGGKTAVDFHDKKNLIGAFYNPVLIYDNIKVLETLPDRLFFAGFAEIMKAGLLADEKYYMWLIDNMYEICGKEPDTIEYMLETAIGIKKTIVEKDPYEKSGLRMLLNLGHTIGHGIESVMGDEYIHGECVALGCVAAAFISFKLDYIKSEEYYEIRDMFVPFNLPISISTDKTDKILNAVKFDKKNTAGTIRMVLLKKIGKAFVYDNVDKDLVKEAIEELNFKDED